MAKRIRVGLLYSYDEDWIGGTYYILNIIHALNVLEDAQKPILVLLSDSKTTFNDVVNETQYPYLEYVQFPLEIKKLFFFQKLINTLFRLLFKKSIFIEKTIYPNIEFLYPRQLKGISGNIKKVNWHSDFQEDHLPQFFSETEINKRKSYQQRIVSQSDIVVFSSEDAKSDFKRLYPNSKAISFVLPFAVTHPDFSKLNLKALLKKYELPDTYFFLPNQFWAHKNHMVVLKAIAHLKDQGIEDLCIVMSGKESDYRNSMYVKELRDFVISHNLEPQIKFLGFLPRTEQLCLFKHAKAIIQPSLFEGWSTVVEDAKALNSFIILSDLKVHREQIQDNVVFFDPFDFVSLALILENYINNSPQVTKLDYKKDIHTFANKFVDLIHMSTTIFN